MKEFICKYGVQLSVALCLIAIPLSLLWQSSVTILLFCFLLSLNIVFHILGFWKSYREYSRKKKKASEKNRINVKKQTIKSRHEIYLCLSLVCISINCLIVFTLRINSFPISKPYYKKGCIDYHYRPYKSQLE